jgi:hypothetical protein
MQGPFSKNKMNLKEAHYNLNNSWYLKDQKIKNTPKLDQYFLGNKQSQEVKEKTMINKI